MSTFSLVTGRDFARSIAWARRQPPNPITAALKKHSMTATSEMKVISRARFFAGGVRHYNYQKDECPTAARENSVINPAEVEYNGIRLVSVTPKTAAEAEKINKALSGE